MKIGDKIKMCGERTRYTVQGFDDRFIIATKPHFGEKLYTIIDKQELRRGPINMVLGLPLMGDAEIDSPEGAEEVLTFMREETGGHDTWGVSRRNNLPLTQNEIVQLKLKVQ